MGVFYENYVTLGLLDPGCIQGGLNVLIGMFRSVGLVANVSKSKTIMCQPGAIWLGISEEAVEWKSTE